MHIPSFDQLKLDWSSLHSPFTNSLILATQNFAKFMHNDWDHIAIVYANENKWFVGLTINSKKEWDILKRIINFSIKKVPKFILDYMTHKTKSPLSSLLKEINNKL